MIVPRSTFLIAALALGTSHLSTCRGSTETTPAATASQPLATALVELPGVDTSSLTPRERREWSTYVSEILAPCKDTPVPIAQCVKEKRGCGRCVPGANFLVKQVRDGKTREQAVDAFRARFDSDRVKSIDLGDTPLLGPIAAPVTMVEWADFECPFCKRAAPMVEEMVTTKFPGKVRLFFKVYPLSAHAHGEPAARAVLAAFKQGKFWEMHHKLFDSAPNGLEQANFEAYAKELGLKLDPFKADMNSDITTAHINRDKKQAESLGFQGTPLIYINGREFQHSTDFATELEEWIRSEIDLGGAGGGAVPQPSAAAASATSAAPASSSGKR